MYRKSKQSWVAEKGYSYSLGAGKRQTNPKNKKQVCYLALHRVWKWVVVNEWSNVKWTRELESGASGVSLG